LITRTGSQNKKKVSYATPGNRCLMYFPSQPIKLQRNQPCGTFLWRQRQAVVA
jgi:hypothetical protein